MYSKKVLILCILEILKNYSSEKNTLEQKDIIKYLKQDYDMECDRKTVKANIMNLIEFGYDIAFDEIPRKNKDGEDENICTNWYLVSEFDSSEITFLINSILFSKSIPRNQANDLIEKIKKISRNNDKSTYRNVYNLPYLQFNDNQQSLYNMNVINEAIEKNLKIQFVYNTYGLDKKMYPRREERYKVSPYQIVANNGKYYLICNYDKYDNVDYYRIDRMTEVEVLSEKAKNKDIIKGLENGINIPEQMAQHVYMFSDEAINIEMKIKKYIVGEVIDWFGKDFSVVKEKDDEALIRLKGSQKAMFYWAIQYGEHVEIIKPITLRNEIIKAVKTMNDKYSK